MRWRGPAIPLAILIAVGIWTVLVPGALPAAGLLEDRSEYLAITGRSGRANESIVWMLDTRTEELIAVSWDDQLKMMRPVGRRDIAADIAVAARGR